MKRITGYHHNAGSRTISFAKYLRKNQTPAEESLWKILRNRNLRGLKFRRQHPLNCFVADFYCHELLLIIELDGDIHNEKQVKIHDRRREKAIKDLGLRVLRFKNEDAIFTPGFIMDKIIELKEEKERGSSFR